MMKTEYNLTKKMKMTLAPEPSGLVDEVFPYAEMLKSGTKAPPWSGGRNRETVCHLWGEGCDYVSTSYGGPHLFVCV